MAKQRVQIMVEPEVYELLRALSDETGQPISPMVNSLLVSLAPGLESTLKMARLVKKLDRDTKESLQGHLGRVANQMKEAVTKNMEEAEQVIKTVQ